MKIEEVDLEAALDEFVVMMPDLDYSSLESGDYNETLEFYFEICKRAIAAGESPLGHYVKASIHCLAGKAPFHDLEMAKEERLKSALLGNVTAAIDYAHQVNMQTTEALALCTAITDSGKSIHSLREDFEFALGKKSSEEKRSIDELARSIQKGVYEKGLKFCEY